MDETQIIQPALTPKLPPTSSIGPKKWIKENLFSTWVDGILSVVISVWVVWTLYKFIRWAIIEAVFTGEFTNDIASGVSKVCANTEGACWAFVAEHWDLFIYGLYPAEERWRPFWGIAVGVLLMGLYFVPKVNKRILTLITLLVYPIAAAYLFSGGFWGLPLVDTPRWGGLFLTLVIASVGIIASFPLGIILALGRQSNLPAIHICCVGFIEFIRGVPLLSLLFMSSAVLPLFLPSGTSLDILFRALVVITFFQAVYLAEAIRGGLQALPPGQYEAASALGLGYWRTQLLIILPQAIKIAIPNIVSSFIALFKDTSLVGIIGLLDLLGLARQALINPAWPNVASEAFTFVVFIYWTFNFSMSSYSQHVEKKLDTN